MAALSPEKINTFSKSVQVLELGCGQVRRWPGSVTIDFNPKSVADVIHDLNVIPYPFKDDTFDVVIAEHVLEHLDDIIAVMEELHRITRDSGTVYVEVPHFSSSNFFTDPTHTHSFSTRSFDYFVPGTWLNEFQYSSAMFRKKKVLLDAHKKGNFIRRLFRYGINRNHQWFEKRLTFIFPRQTINFELEVIKDDARGELSRK